MLKEIQAVRQIPGEPPRRWFNDDALDLILWQDDSGTLLRFQLAYDKDRDEQLVEWTPDTGLRHYMVDTGETHPLQHGMTPILLPAQGEPDLSELVALFLERSRMLDPVLSQSIVQRLTTD